MTELGQEYFSNDIKNFHQQLVEKVKRSPGRLKKQLQAQAQEIIWK